MLTSLHFFYALPKKKKVLASRDIADEGKVQIFIIIKLLHNKYKTFFSRNKCLK